MLPAMPTGSSVKRHQKLTHPLPVKLTHLVAVDYDRQTVFIKWFGSHAAYDDIDVRTIEFDFTHS